MLDEYNRCELVKKPNGSHRCGTTYKSLCPYYKQGVYMLVLYEDKIYIAKDCIGKQINRDNGKWEKYKDIDYIVNKYNIKNFYNYDYKVNKIISLDKFKQLIEERLDKVETILNENNTKGNMNGYYLEKRGPHIGLFDRMGNFIKWCNKNEVQELQKTIK